MQVETYEVTELDSITGYPECDEEAIALIEELDLKGQKSLVNSETDDDPERCPYRLMNRQEQATFKVLFPERTLVESYRSGPIPLRVLQMIAHARELFKEVFVMHPSDARDPDPVLCATNNGYYSGFNGIYILARWGEALVPMDELATRAVKIVREKLIGRLKGFKATIDKDLILLDTISDDDLMSGATDRDPSYFGLRLS